MGGGEHTGPRGRSGDPPEGAGASGDPAAGGPFLTTLQGECHQPSKRKGWSKKAAKTGVGCME